MKQGEFDIFIYVALSSFPLRNVINVRVEKSRIQQSKRQKTLSAKIKIKKFGGKQKFLSPQRIFDMFTLVDTILQYKALQRNDDDHELHVLLPSMLNVVKSKMLKICQFHTFNDASVCVTPLKKTQKMTKSRWVIQVVKMNVR